MSLNQSIDSVHRKGGSVTYDSVSVIGLGRLGAPLALCCASRGFKTIGVDIDESKILHFRSGVFPWFEPKAQDYLSRFQPFLSFTTSHKDAIEQTDVSIVLTATPSEPNGRFSSKFVIAALESLVKEQIRQKKPLHLYIVSSTLFPGASHEEVIPILSKVQDAGLNFLYAYCPEFVALGSVIKNFLKPDFVVIGEMNERSGNAAKQFYERFLEKECPLIRTNLTNAELAKISLNMFLTLKISFANLLSEICEQFEGADVDEIMRILGKDKRISPKFMKGGTAFGGTCFPRDVKAFTFLTSNLDSSLPRSVHQLNERQIWRLARQIVDTGKRRVCILGTSFKPNTSETTASPSHKLIDQLLSHGLEIVVHDPLALERTESEFGDMIRCEPDVQICIKKADVVVVMVPHKEYQRLYNAFEERHIVFDVWRLYRGRNLSCTYKGTGIGS